MTVKNANFTAQIQNFTSTTYIMIVSKDISIGSIDFNIERVDKFYYSQIQKQKKSQPNQPVNNPMSINGFSFKIMNDLLGQHASNGSDTSK